MEELATGMHPDEWHEALEKAKNYAFWNKLKRIFTHISMVLFGGAALTGGAEKILLVGWTTAAPSFMVGIILLVPGFLILKEILSMQKVEIDGNALYINGRRIPKEAKIRLYKDKHIGYLLIKDGNDEYKIHWAYALPLLTLGYHVKPGIIDDWFFNKEKISTP